MQPFGKSFKIKIAFISLFIPVCLFSQEFDLKGKIDAVVILSNEEEIPFWLHTNTNMTIGEFTNLSITGDFTAVLSFNNFKINGGAAIYGRDGVIDNIQRRDLYVQFENSWLFATIGAKRQTEKLDGLSATNQNFLWSGNARPLPGILFEANNPLKISKTFGVDWGIGHYQLNDERYVKNTLVHYKRLALITTFNENHKLKAQIQHFAQWGGTSPESGKLKNGFKDFVNVFFAHTPEEYKTEDGVLNKLGNHLGSYLLEYEFKNNWGSFSTYYEHPFEDGSGTRLANFPDGVWGAFFKPKNQKIISSVLYEYINTTDQSGAYGASGRDNYFSNIVYKSGWTYEENIIGAPFILFDKNIEITDTTTAFISNRSKTHHFGVMGEFGNFQWKLKTTVTKYLGTYRKPFSPEWNYWYNYGSLSYKHEKLGTFTVMAGADFSNIAKALIGGGIEYSYKF
jgi:hypothetical protein